MPLEILGEGWTLVAVTDRDRLGVQAAQQWAILRHELDVTALGALQHNVAAGRAIRQKREFGEDVAVELIVATQALHSAHAGGGLLLRLRGSRSAGSFDGWLLDARFLGAHTNFPSRDSTSA